LRRKAYGEAVEVFQTMADQYGDGRLYGRALFGLEEALVGQIDRTYREKRYVEVLRLFHSEQQRGLKGLIQPAPLVQIADSYQQLGLFEKADEVLGRVDVAEATPAERESLHVLKIQGLMAQERWKVLEPELKGYLRKYPKGRIRLKALRSLAEVLIREERWAEAEGFLNKASREAGTGVERARMEHLLARVFTHGERYAMAVDSLRRAIRMTPAGEAAPPFLADAYYLLGENLMALGQFSEAASVLKKVASRFPKDGLRGWALFEAGAAQRRIGELQGASKTLEAVSTGPASGFWRRMAQAMKEDIEWWQKHDRLQN
ncbi:MAG: tetratricopeptide repeat protein, partial [Nitrospinota bacterium]